MTQYVSMVSHIRNILEKKKFSSAIPDGGPEKDMNDQVAAGSYQTKSFEMSNPAQKLYANLPKDTDSDAATTAVVNLDKLFAIDKNTAVEGYATKQDMASANDLADRVRSAAKKMKLEKEHEDILKTSLDRIEKKLKDEPANVIAPEDFKSPADDPRFKSPSKNYQTDKKNDRDIDNVKQFLIRRSLRAQRKLKIIDDD